MGAFAQLESPARDQGRAELLAPREGGRAVCLGAVIANPSLTPKDGSSRSGWVGNQGLQGIRSAVSLCHSDDVTACATA